MAKRAHSSHDAPDAGAAQPSAASNETAVQERSTYMTDLEAEKFCQTFADGLASGLSYVRILTLLERQGLDQKAVDRLRAALIERGDQLGEALIRFGILDSNARNLVVVAEMEGALPETFAQLARTYHQRSTRKRRFLKAMIEPFVLVSLGIICFGNILSVGVAQLAFGGDTIQQAIDLGVESLVEIGLFGVVCAAAALIWLSLPVDMGLRDLGARLWMRMPVISEPARQYSISMFCRYLQKGIDAGMTIHESIGLAADAANHPRILSHAERAQKLIKQGRTLTEAISIIPALSDEVIDRIELGEESGRLDQRLVELADRYKERADETFDGFMRAFTLVLRYAVVVFVIVAAFMSLLDQQAQVPGVDVLNGP